MSIVRRRVFVTTAAAFVSLAAPVAAPATAHAAVRLPALVGSHMVLQREAPARVWGWAAPGETVRVSVGGANGEAVAGPEGRWTIDLPPQPAGGPFAMTVNGRNSLRLEDVWFGEVWVASGQSNMEFALAQANGGTGAAEAGCDGLRLFTVAKATSLERKEDVSGHWAPCDASTAPAFSAVAFFFGQAIQRALGVKVGLVHSSWGGTPAEAWTSRGALSEQPSLRPLVADFDLALKDAGARAKFAERLEAWEAANYHQDAGNEGLAKGWAKPEADTTGWQTMELPQYWEKAGLPIDGAVWFRRAVEIPAAWSGKALRLSLGALDDFDTTWFAGEEIGRTGRETPGYWSVPRQYTVPGHVVKPGRAVVAVRVFDHYGNGGFAGVAPELWIAPADASVAKITLAGPWDYRVERSLPPAAPDFATQPRYPSPDNPNSPTVLFGAMVAPLTPLSIRGAIWYQGESNAGAAYQYRTLFPTMIRDWRRAWGAGDFPFLFVQLANYMARPPEPGDSQWAELREAQALTLALPNTGMAIAIDIGEAGDIHPKDKSDVGERLARWALADTYGRDIEKSGPLYRSFSVEGSAIRVRFDHAAGLTTADGAAPKGFAIAGADRKWRWADARVDGETVVVSSPEVPQPAAVRYAWADNPEATLRNRAGLPASPFRTDDWPMLTAPRAPADGRELVRAMHARYAGRWYRDFMLVQDVTRYRESGESKERVAEYISLPGRVRAITGPIEDGNAEIYADGVFHVYEKGRPTREMEYVHGVLNLGFDVYVQEPERTIAQVEALGVDLGRIRDAEWKGRPAWVVGAAEGDVTSPQFWVEKDRLLCTRLVWKRQDAVLDVDMGRFEPLGQGWIAADLLFKRNGQPAVHEDYVTFGLVDRMDPSLFETRTLKTSGPLPAVVPGGDEKGSFRNPVIPGFHPDPSIVRVGGDFYLVTSSFEFFPGVPLFTSRDLVHWKQLGHVLTRETQLPLGNARPSGGIYAPTLRHHDGTFYVITTNIDGGGNFLVTAKDPAGPWSDPVWLHDFGGIDPSLFFDDDGTMYLTGLSRPPGKPHGIYQTTLDPKTGAILQPSRLVWDRTGTRYPEGPHLYKIKGRYYLMIAEGGTEYGHMVTLARGDSPWGPFEPCPRNPILTNRQTENDVPVQGTGHADLVEAPDGSWWMVFLAFRPASGYFHHLGRETFLAPVTWDAGGWPVVNGGQPIGLAGNAEGLPPHPFPPAPVRTGFDAPLGPEWNYLRNPDTSSYSLDSRAGWLTLRGRATSLGEPASPTWVGRRQEHFSGRVATLVDFVPRSEGEEAGLSVYMNPDHRYEMAVRHAGGHRQVFVRQRIGPYLEAVTASANLDGLEPVVLQVECTPEEYSFSYGLAVSGSPQVATKPLGKAAARYLSSEVAGGFTGVYFGLYATGNGEPASTPAHFDWLDDDPGRQSEAPPKE
jgi:sialate O-acetylesterase